MRLTVATGLVVAVTAWGAAQGPADEILRLEQERLKAAQAGRMSGLMASDAYRVTPPGDVGLATVPGQPNPAAYAKDVTVVAATASSGVVHSLTGPRPANAVREIGDGPDRSLRVWARQGDAWKLVATQGVWVRQAPRPGAAQRTDVKDVPFTPANPAEAAVAKANQALNEAFRARDAAAYEAHTAPEFVRISSFGNVTSRADFVKNAVLGGTGTRLAPASDETRVRIYGDVAVITYRNLRGNERMMRVFMNREGSWKAVAAISTIIRDTPAK